MSFNVSYIFDLQDKMSGKIRNITSNMQNMSNKVRIQQMSIRDSLNKTNQTLDSMKSRIKGVAGAYIGFHSVMGITRNLESFERSLNRAQSLTRATGDEIKILRSEAQRLGATTEKTASQVATAQGNLGLLGLTVKQIKQSMPGFIDLSTALGISLEEAADLGAKMMAKLNIPMSETQTLLDKIAVASTRSGTDLSRLSQASQMAGASLVSVGADMNEAIAIMGKAEESLGERTGASIAAFIRQVQKAEKITSAGGKVLAQYGINFDDINPKTNKLLDIMERLQPVLQDGVASYELLGDEGRRLPQVIARQISAVRQLEEQIAAGSGELQNMAGIMRQGMPGALDRMRSALDGLLKSLGEAGLTKAIENVANAITKLANFITENQFIMKATLQVVAFIGKVWLLSKAFKAVLAVSRLLRVAFIGLGAVNPFTAILISATLFYELIKKIPEMMQKIYEKFTFIKKIGSFITGSIPEGSRIQRPQSNISPPQAPAVQQLIQGGGQQSTTADINVNFANMPKGASTEVTQSKTNWLNLGVNSVVAGI
jgi:TP901 family phage tail tape measure protein